MEDGRQIGTVYPVRFSCRFHAVWPNRLCKLFERLSK